MVSSQHSLSAPGSLAAENEMTVADCWFAALDQRSFISDSRLWITRVMGVHLDGLHTWIQLEFAEHPDSAFLLHLTPWAGLQDAISVIRGEILRAEA
jgi:hypothetical protein